MAASLEIRVESDLHALAPFRRRLDRWLQDRGIDEPPRAAVVLAAHEAVANAIEHSHSASPVVIKASMRSDGIVVEISDDGEWRIPRSSPIEECGGGLSLIKNLVSDVQISSGEDGTKVRLFQEHI